MLNKNDHSSDTYIARIKAKMKYGVSPLKPTVLAGLQRSLGAPCHAQTFLQSICKARTGVMKNSKCFWSFAAE